ncbi:4Fe-4S dicluster domain-containing protein [Clostridioides difficile]
MGVMELAKTVIKNLLSPSITKNYPKEEKENYELTRGHIEINIENCVFCGLCSRKCPTGAITVSRNEKSWQIDRLECIQCGYCIDNCPKKTLIMKNDYIKPSEVEEIDSYLKNR